MNKKKVQFDHGNPHFFRILIECTYMYIWNIRRRKKTKQRLRERDRETERERERERRKSREWRVGKNTNSSDNNLGVWLGTDSIYISYFSYV